MPYPELVDRLRAADVVVTHAGNTVRLVQRLGGTIEVSEGPGAVFSVALPSKVPVS